MQNAVTAQQQLNTLAQAATSQSVTSILKSANTSEGELRDHSTYQSIATELSELKSALAAFEKKAPPSKQPTRKGRA